MLLGLHTLKVCGYLFTCRPLPNHGYVEDYIKAYYLSEADTEDWIRKHSVSRVAHLATRNFSNKMCMLFFVVVTVVVLLLVMGMLPASV